MSVAYHAEMALLGDLLRKYSALVAPPYQREYSWGLTEFDLLLSRLAHKLDDLEERGWDSGSYYFGNMLLLITNVAPRWQLLDMARARRGAIRADIVDGKQRLVTITILLAVLRDILGSSGASVQDWIAVPQSLASRPQWLPRIELAGEEAAFFGEFVVPPGSTLRKITPGHDSRGVRQMRKARWRFRRELADGSWTPQRLQALLRLITRGCIVNVTQTDNLAEAYDIFVINNRSGVRLSSSDMLKAMLIGATVEGRRAAYHEGWTGLEKRIGAQGLESLFSHIVTLESRRHAPVLEQIPAMAQSLGIERFIDQKLLPTARHLEIVLRAEHTGAPQSPEINRLLTYLGWLRSRDWTPPLLAYMRKSPGEAEGLLRFLKTLDRLVYVNLITGIGTDKRRQRYRQVMERILDGAQADAPGGPLALTRDEQVLAYRQAQGKLYARGPLPCKLVLLRLCDTYPGSELPKDLRRISVEHVLPQNVGSGDYWRARFPDADEREKAVRSIANHVLVTRSQNDQARNHSWQQKRAVYFMNGRDTPFAVTNQLKGLSEWTPAELQAREADLMSRLSALWDLEAPTSGTHRQRRRKARAA